jgi:hypothetical protein
MDISKNKKAEVQNHDREQTLQDIKCNYLLSGRDTQRELVVPMYKGNLQG